MKDLFIADIHNTTVTDEGVSMMVGEQYLVEASDFAAVENTVRSDAAGTGEMEFQRITRPKVAEVFDGAGEKFYRVKITITTLDEKTGMDKKSTQAYLVRENTLEGAMHEFTEAMRGTLSDWEFTSVNETKIVDYLRA